MIDSHPNVKCAYNSSYESALTKQIQKFYEKLDKIPEI